MENEMSKLEQINLVKQQLKDLEKKYVELKGGKLDPTSKERNSCKYKYEFKVGYKEKIKENLAKRIECDCGVETTKRNMSHHRKTAKHQKYIDSIANIADILCGVTENYIEIIPKDSILHQIAKMKNENKNILI